MRELGKKKHKHTLEGHQDCSTCHPPTKNGKAKEREKTEKEILEQIVCSLGSATLVIPQPEAKPLPCSTRCITEPRLDVNVLREVLSTAKATMYDRALEFVRTEKKVRVSMMQRGLQISFNTALDLIDEMKSNGVLKGPYAGMWYRLHDATPEQEKP